MTKFKDVAHLYLGCTVQYPDTIVGKNVTAMLTGVTMSEIETTYKRKRRGCSGDILSWQPTANHNSDALHTKPILRPLSSMTEDEDTDLCAFCLMSELEHKEKWDSLLKSEAKRTTYLLSKGFDLFGLIESGEAIDATLC